MFRRRRWTLEFHLLRPWRSNAASVLSSIFQGLVAIFITHPELNQVIDDRFGAQRELR